MNILKPVLMGFVLIFTMHVHAEDFVTRSELLQAAHNCDIETIKQYISEGRDVDVSFITDHERTIPRFSGFSALMVSVDRDCHAGFDALLAAGANVNFQTQHGLTPLMLSVNENNMEAFTKLMNHPEIDPTLTTYKAEKTALMFAEGQMEFFTTWLAAGKAVLAKHEAEGADLSKIQAVEEAVASLIDRQQITQKMIEMLKEKSGE
jgi:hypothetical protein